MEAFLTHIGAAMLGAIFGFFLAVLMVISGRESDREMMREIPDELQPAGIAKQRDPAIQHKYQSSYSHTSRKR